MYGLVLIHLFLNLLKEFSAISWLQTRAAKCQIHILLLYSLASLFQISDFEWCFCLLLDIKHSTWKAPLLGRHCWGTSEDPDAPGGAFQQGSPGHCWCLAESSGVFSVWWMWSCGGMCQKSHQVSQATFNEMFSCGFFNSYQWKCMWEYDVKAENWGGLMKLVTDELISLHVV